MLRHSELQLNCERRGGCFIIRFKLVVETSGGVGGGRGSEKMERGGRSPERRDGGGAGENMRHSCGSGLTYRAARDDTDGRVRHCTNKQHTLNRGHVYKHTVQKHNTRCNTLAVLTSPCIHAHFGESYRQKGPRKCKSWGGKNNPSNSLFLCLLWVVLK